MPTTLTQRTVPSPSTPALARLAERWSPAGVFLACFRTDGSLAWHDTQMPRVMALCLAPINLLSRHIARFSDSADIPSAALFTPVTGLQAHLLPVVRRRRVAAWLAVLAHTDNLAATEDLQRACSHSQLDVSAVLAAGQRAPLISPAQLPALANAAAQMYDDLSTAQTSQHELSGVTEQLSSVYEEISLLYKISSHMRFSQKPQAFLETVCRDMQEIGNFRAVAVAFADRKEENSPATVGEFVVQIGQCSLHGPSLLSALHAPLHESLALGELQVHNELPENSPAPLKAAMRRFISVPLMRDTRPLGILIAIDKNDDTDFTTVDTKLLSNVASQCSIFLENAALYQDMQDLFMGVLHALTRSIDAKDAYTRGHSQRVAELSRALARKAGLPEEQCERIYLSGLLHDVGKIGVPEAVLTKPGRLTDAEFEAIKKHPAIGGQILGNIKQLQDILPGVLYHHERWDGRGYPHSLASENIPLMGRIICVADSFDAMSSTRTYRPALPLETVLNEIRRCSGAQFDPVLAKHFVELDFGPYRQAVEEQLQQAGPVPTEAAQ